MVSQRLALCLPRAPIHSHQDPLSQASTSILYIHPSCMPQDTPPTPLHSLHSPHATILQLRHIVDIIWLIQLPYPAVSCPARCPALPHLTGP